MKNYYLCNMKRLYILFCLLFLNTYVFLAFAQTVEDGDMQLELPHPPSDIKIPAQRAEWLSEHYWDNLDFSSDTLRSQSRDFMEQNFSTWIDLLGHVDMSHRDKPIKQLIDKASFNHSSLMMLVDIAEEYLYIPHSPYADEAKYKLWTEILLKSSKLSDIEQYMLKTQLEEMNVNPVGGKATDIEVEVSDGSVNNLLSFLATDRPTVLFFYDPDCHDCSAAVPQLTDIGLRYDAPAIIAVCCEGSEADWERKRSIMPDSWTHVYAADKLSQYLDEEGPYILPAMPTFYLLDSEGTILSKNWRPDNSIQK